MRRFNSLLIVSVVLFTSAIVAIAVWLGTQENTAAYATGIKTNDQPPVGTATIRKSHPRILLPELSAWNGENIPPLIRSRFGLYKIKNIEMYSACGIPGLMARVACWITSGKSSEADRLIQDMKSFQIKAPQVVTTYGNAWQLAFAYDFLLLYPGFSEEDRRIVEGKIASALKEYIQVLESDSPSLWHGRTTLASRAWLCAVVLDLFAEDSREFISSAQRHFMNSANALAFTEAWPEGYTYWIQERAFDFVLAAAAYINGMENTANKGKLINTLKRTGLWHIYATRPDNRIEGFGDEGSRTDLKDETRRVIDLIAQLTKDPVFSVYSRYIEKLHGPASYYSEYRWGFPLFNDPEISMKTPTDGTLDALNVLLPKSEIFGKNSYNLAFIRSDWSPEATFISFRAGDSFTHHAHYDAGHFTLFKNSPLAINSSTYGGMFTDNRLYYSMRTIAKNSLLIQRPGETVMPNKKFQKNVSDGGQRLVFPTGSAVLSVEDWQSNLGSGMHSEGGKLLSFQNADSDYVYIAADLTAAYNTRQHDTGGRGGKVTKVIRELVYLIGEDVLLVHDDVASSQPNYTKKWLLHTANRPEVEGLELLKGSSQNGILQSTADKAVINNNNAYLIVQRFYPANAVIRLVGGEDFRFYVESDGDDADLDGVNFFKGAANKPWFDRALWRLEIQPSVAKKEDKFLIALSPKLQKPREPIIKPLHSRGNGRGLVSDKSIIVFVDPVKHGHIEFRLPAAKRNLILLGTGEMVDVRLSDGSNHEKLGGTSGRVIKYRFDPGVFRRDSLISLQW